MRASLALLVVALAAPVAAQPSTAELRGTFWNAGADIWWMDPIVVMRRVEGPDGVEVTWRHAPARYVRVVLLDAKGHPIKTFDEATNLTRSYLYQDTATVLVTFFEGARAVTVEAQPCVGREACAAAVSR